MTTQQPPTPATPSSLPVSEPTTMAPPAEQRSPTKRLPSLDEGVLFVVDDEAMVTSSIEGFLMLETDYDVFTFNNPEEAVAALEEHQPELVVSDFVMPQMNGIEFLRQVKAKLPETTCILLTGYADKENAIAAINEVGIYRYIEKPWDNQDLLLNLQNGLERARLVSHLHQTINELNVAQEQLKHYNQELEAIVAERTQSLQQTRDKLQSIIDNTADAIISIDDQGVLTSWNPTLERWLKTTELSGMNLFSSLRLPKGLSQEELLQSAGPRQFEVLLGDLLPLEVSLAPLKTKANPDGTGFVLLLRDIAARKDTERLRDDFISTLTHDMRTPLLAAIQTFDFFLDGTLGEVSEQQTKIVTMLQGSHRDLLGLVNTLLEVYKYEAGKQKLVRAELDLSKLCHSICEELSALASSRDQGLTCVVPEEVLIVQGDRQELRRVLVNLIGNALHHSPPGGQVKVDAKQEDSILQISIIDNGRGIPADDIPHLFKRFSQGTSKKRNSGTGLGLYLSRQIVEAHEGTIGVRSEEGVGSEFYIQLPITAQ